VGVAVRVYQNGQQFAEYANPSNLTREKWECLLDCGCWCTLAVRRAVWQTHVPCNTAIRVFGL
jgi:hypothetical protein